MNCKLKILSAKITTVHTVPSHFFLAAHEDVSAKAIKLLIRNMVCPMVK
jgi:hypothetical protein